MLTIDPPERLIEGVPLDESPCDVDYLEPNPRVELRDERLKRIELFAAAGFMQAHEYHNERVVVAMACLYGDEFIAKSFDEVFELAMKCQREGQPRQYCRLLQLADCLEKRRSYKIRAF